ncbi:hypothetical protein ACRRTK_003311 [Alexandromys fortis]
MPLMVFCGLLSSCKSQWTEELSRALADKGRTWWTTPSVLGDQDTMARAYGDPVGEKALRAALRAAILSRQDVVILDSLNYIKGFSY